MCACARGRERERQKSWEELLPLLLRRRSLLRMDVCSSKSCVGCLEFFPDERPVARAGAVIFFAPVPDQKGTWDAHVIVVVVALRDVADARSLACDACVVDGMRRDWLERHADHKTGVSTAYQK